MRNLFALISLIVGSCSAQEYANQYANEIQEEDLKQLLYVYSSDYFEGRRTGSEGQKRAADFLRNFYQSHQIRAAEGTDNYYQDLCLLVDKKSNKPEPSSHYSRE